MNMIVSFSFKEDKEPVVQEFKKIAKREGKDKSKLLIEIIEEYVKVHSAGNSTFKLDDFQDPDFKAMPATMSSKDKWSKFIRNDMSLEERMELDKIADHIRKEIDAKNWLESRNK